MENAVRKLQDHRKLYTIGQVLTVLKPEFGDLSPSKLRFLEDQGLVTPERTDAGYRKYSETQIERLRIVCLLYTSPSPRDYAASRMPSSA